jgi:hypothetical protein
MRLPIERQILRLMPHKQADDEGHNQEQPNPSPHTDHSLGTREVRKDQDRRQERFYNQQREDEESEWSSYRANDLPSIVGHLGDYGRSKGYMREEACGEVGEPLGYRSYSTP